MKVSVGDVFRFSFNEETAKKRLGGYDWCFDGKLIAEKRGGEIRLADTYWCSPENFYPVEHWEKLGTLTFMCNLNDVEDPKISDAHLYYDDADIFDLSYQHRCYQRVLVRKGAKRSQEKMTESLLMIINEQKSNVEYQLRRIEQNEEMLRQVESGNLNGYIY